MKTSSTQKAEALASLRNLLKRGDVVYTILVNRSRSGMMRTIRLVTFYQDPSTKEILPLHPNYSASVLLEIAQDKSSDGLKVRGCGQDMGSHLVYNLSCAMFDGDGHALKHRWL